MRTVPLILAHISHTFLLRGGQVLAWLRQTAQFDPQCMNNTYPVKLLVFLARQGLTTARDEKCEKSGLAATVIRRVHQHLPATNRRQVDLARFRQVRASRDPSPRT